MLQIIQHVSAHACMRAETRRQTSTAVSDKSSASRKAGSDEDARAYPKIRRDRCEGRRYREDSLRQQIRSAFRDIPNADLRQCGKCAFGPMVNLNCDDMGTHADEYANTCPRCGHFEREWKRFPMWSPSRVQRHVRHLPTASGTALGGCSTTTAGTFRKETWWRQAATGTCGACPLPHLTRSFLQKSCGESFHKKYLENVRWPYGKLTLQTSSFEKTLGRFVPYRVQIAVPSPEAT